MHSCWIHDTRAFSGTMRIYGSFRLSCRQFWRPLETVNDSLSIALLSTSLDSWPNRCCYIKPPRLLTIWQIHDTRTFCHVLPVEETICEKMGGHAWVTPFHRESPRVSGEVMSTPESMMRAPPPLCSPAFNPISPSNTLLARFPSRAAATTVFPAFSSCKHRNHIQHQKHSV